MSDREGFTQVERDILRAVRDLRYGSVEITVHDVGVLHGPGDGHQPPGWLHHDRHKGGGPAHHVLSRHAMPTITSYTTKYDLTRPSWICPTGRPVTASTSSPRPCRVPATRG